MISSLPYNNPWYSKPVRCIVYIDHETSLTRSLNERISRMLWRIVLTSTQDSIADHQRSDISLAVGRSRPFAD